MCTCVWQLCRNAGTQLFFPQAQLQNFALPAVVFYSKPDCSQGIRENVATILHLYIDVDNGNHLVKTKQNFTTLYELPSVESRQLTFPDNATNLYICIYIYLILLGSRFCMGENFRSC
jgi:hypothetical protein